MTYQDEVDAFIDVVSADWFSAQDQCCSCHNNPPCSWCVSGYGLPLAEFLSNALEEQFGPLEERNPHSDFDRAMRVLGDF